MNTAFKFEITTKFYSDIKDAIRFLIKKGKINAYTGEQIEDVAYKVHSMHYNDLQNAANHVRHNEWEDIVWFSYENMINLIQPFFDEIEDEE